MCSSQIEQQEKQEQIVPERCARLSHDPWKSDLTIFFAISDHFWNNFFWQIYFWPRIDINDPKECNDSQLFDDPSYSMINWKYGLW